MTKMSAFHPFPTIEFMDMTAFQWKIGAVSYLNTLPLVQGMDAAAEVASLEFDLPSRLADRLSLGQIDVALIPSIEVFQNPAYTIVSNACIACRGPVWSVKLMSRVPVERIKSLALDEGSRTSVALVRLLLDRQCSIRPELMTLPIESRWQAAPTDAVLIIGDRAMNPDADRDFPVEIDLGQWWYEETGLPFVFAMWTARPGIPQEELDRIGHCLSTSRDAGVRMAGEIAAGNALRYGLSVQQATDYFRKYLHFTLEVEERNALNRFREMASQLNLAPPTLQLQYHDC